MSLTSLPHRFATWLHTGWPAGRIEKLPVVAEDGSTQVPGLYVVGDLGGIPLLKFAADSGARVASRIARDLEAIRRETSDRDVRDLVILGAGVSGMSAALEARTLGLDFELLEASEPFSTLVNFPRGKPIYTYPTGMRPAGSLLLRAGVKESLLEELRQQTVAQGIAPRQARATQVLRRGGVLEVHLADGAPIRAHRVIVAIGRSGNHRRLGVPGEDLGKVSNRLHDPADYRDLLVLVVGGGDSALEAAIALAQAGADVTLAHRGETLSRPKKGNLQAIEALKQAARVRVLPGTQVRRIEPDAVVLSDTDGTEQRLANDAVFVLIGREPPLEFFRRSGVPLRNELRPAQWSALLFFLTFCIVVYNWKAGGALKHLFETRGWFPFNVPHLLAALGDAAALASATPSTWLGTATLSLTEPGFYYSTAYSLTVILFGIRRIRRRNTPYITAQTLSLMAIQVLPLFLIPYFILPYLGNNGLFDAGWLRSVGDALFPAVGYGHGREYWRAFGFILAWPLFIWNVFHHQPLWAWLLISLVQTFVLIPLLVYFWGKGAYCGWICSCGALAETLGDGHRHKMPHGPGWNRLNLAGQGILGLALLLLFARIVSWAVPGTTVGELFRRLFDGLLSGWQVAGIQLNYYWIVDVTLAGIVGVGLYFWFSGRIWCRFFCPLAALMHLYTRFGRFRILSDKKKCISCGVCTAVCHQGIDVMSFANKGLPMADPQCVRCSACVQSCPTGVLEFGQVDPRTGTVLRVDGLTASPVRRTEATFLV